MQYTPVEMIKKLVSFDTTSRDSNLPMIEFIQDYLSQFGVESHLVKNEDASKANLYATIGPMVEGGVVLSGHTDVVPVDGQAWDHDPFDAIEKDGKLFGRGTSDMKSFYAIALAMVPQFIEKGINKPIHFALSYDEEIGCFGAPDLIDQIALNLPKPRAVIVGEPTMMAVVNGQKGVNGLVTKLTGHAAHSSQPHRGISAINMAAKLIEFIDEMMTENKARAKGDCLFVPPYTTMTVGVIKGGTASNIISQNCQFEWDIRNIPEDDPQDFVERLRIKSAELIADAQKIAPEASIETIEDSVVPALAPEGTGQAEALCKHLTGSNNTAVVSYATEGGQFQERGFSTVICGPGSIDQAHQANEYIDISQVKECEKFMNKLADWLV